MITLKISFCGYCSTSHVQKVPVVCAPMANVGGAKLAVCPTESFVSKIFMSHQQVQATLGGGFGFIGAGATPASCNGVTILTAIIRLLVRPDSPRRARDRTIHAE